MKLKISCVVGSFPTLGTFRVRFFKGFEPFYSDFQCETCKEGHPAVLDFHHINDDKEGNISRMVSDTISKDRILAEIDKCIVLCANCHRKLHWDIYKK